MKLATLIGDREWPLVIEVPKNNEKRISEINLLHTETLERILTVIFKSHDVGQPLSGWCRLSMAGANCRWQVCIADGRYTLSMAGLGYQWVVWVWLLGGGWLALLAIVGSLGGVNPVVGSLLGLCHCWVIGRCYSSSSCTVGIGYGRGGGCAVMAVVSIVWSLPW